VKRRANRDTPLLLLRRDLKELFERDKLKTVVREVVLEELRKIGLVPPPPAPERKRPDLRIVKRDQPEP